MTVLTAKTSVRTHGEWIESNERTMIVIEADMASMTWRGTFPSGVFVTGKIWDESVGMVLWDHDNVCRFPFADLTWSVKEPRRSKPVVVERQDSPLVVSLRGAISECDLREDAWHGEDGISVLTEGEIVSQLRIRGIGPEVFSREDLRAAMSGGRWAWAYRYRGFINVAE